MVNISCKAYLKAKSPFNIMSAFRKSVIYPFKKHAVSPEKLYPAELYKDKNPVQKVQALKGWKEAVELFLLKIYKKKERDMNDTEK